VLRYDNTIVKITIKTKSTTRCRCVVGIDELGGARKKGVIATRLKHLGLSKYGIYKFYKFITKHEDLWWGCGDS
jgi:hypothetical protein